MTPDWTAISAIATALAVAVALGTTLLQEWRVTHRVEAAGQALRQGAVDTLRQGWIAIDDACEVFYPAGQVDREEVRKRLVKVERARRLISLFVTREVDPRILIGLLQMDDHLVEASNVLTQALRADRLAENAEFNGKLNQAATAAQLLFISL